ncbi:hypothetical protein AB3459_23710, partial [Pseudomonas aeruginosa]
SVSGRRPTNIPRACPAREHMDCPTFRRLLRAAAAGAIKPRRKAPGA